MDRWLLRRDVCSVKFNCTYEWVKFFIFCHEILAFLFEMTTLPPVNYFKVKQKCLQFRFAQ